MPLVPDVETDLRYLQDSDAQFVDFESWKLARNPFERRLATNLRPGMVLDLDLQTLRRVLGTAVLRRDAVVTVDLSLQPRRALARIITVSTAALPPICADDSSNFLYALSWFLERGEKELRLSVQGESFFWIHAREGMVARTQAPEPGHPSTQEASTHDQV